MKITISLVIVALVLWLFFGYNNSPEQDYETVNKSHIVKRQNFVLPDLNGQEQEFSQWNDKVVLLNFWATWCPPCRKEIPDFIDVYKQYKDKDFIIVGVGTDSPQKIARFVKKLAIPYPILVGGQKSKQVYYQYGNHSGALPYSILIDKNGVIRYRAGGLISKQKLIAQISPLL